MKDIINKIYEKEFDKAMRGFNTEQVDEFLDEIIVDIENLSKYVETLKAESDDIEKENFKLKMEILELQKRKDTIKKNNIKHECEKKKIENTDVDTLEKKMVLLEKEIEKLKLGN